MSKPGVASGSTSVDTFQCREDTALTDTQRSDSLQRSRLDIQADLHRAWQLHQTGDLDSAESVYRQAIKRDAKFADSWVYLGILLFDRRLFHESIQAYRRAIEIQPSFPIAWNNLGNSHRMLGAIDEADKCFEESLSQDPSYLSALKNRGTLWIWSGDIHRGMQWYQKGLQVDPQNAELHRNIGVIELLRGNYETGWREYRWRWVMGGLYRPKTSVPIWQGQQLAGKRFLLYPEQGLGDAIHFVRVAENLKRMGAIVTLQCDPKLIALFSSTTDSLNVDQLISDALPVPQVDYHASMIEVVDILYQQSKTLPLNEELFGLDGGYLTVSLELIAYWKQRLIATCNPGNASRAERKRVVGINWQGNPDHHADVYRSIALAEFEPLARRNDIQLVSLQFGKGSEQLDECDFASRIIRLPADVDQDGNAFTDTAAVIANLDAVVTTDTSIAHLAGAIHRPNVHLILGKIPDWRWLMDGVQTKWYPSMRLHRQSQFGKWDAVMQEIVGELSYDD